MYSKPVSNAQWVEVQLIKYLALLKDGRFNLLRQRVAFVCVVHITKEIRNFLRNFNFEMAIRIRKFSASNADFAKKR